jgi:hypothetical protein
MASIIGVQELQHTNGTSAATIDSSGRILTPARPSFFAYKATGDSSDINYTSTTQVNFDSVQHNIGNCFSTSSNKFIVPVDGVYHFSWQVRMSNTTTAGYLYSALRKNGSLDWGSGLNIYAQLEDPQGGSFQAPSTSATVELTANDEIDVAIAVNNDTTTRINNNTTFFSGFLVG